METMVNVRRLEWLDFLSAMLLFCWKQLINVQGSGSQPFSWHHSAHQKQMGGTPNLECLLANLYVL